MPRPGHRVCCAAHGLPSGVELDVVATALFDDRQGAFRNGQPSHRSQALSQHRFGQWQGHLPVAQTPQHRVGHGPALAKTAMRFAGQQHRQPAVADALPQCGVELAGLGTFTQAFVHGLREEPLGAVLHQVLGHSGVACVVFAVRRVVHRRSIPLATMPRKISRVPPRSENEGAAKVM